MSKNVTSAELAEIITTLLATGASGKMQGHGTFQEFMTDIAQVVCDHCGGEIHDDANADNGKWSITIHGEGTPHYVAPSVWHQVADKRELYPKNSPGWLASKFGNSHPKYSRSEWQKDERAPNGTMPEEYWEWVSHKVLDEQERNC